MTSIFILNGPPGSGKDTLAHALISMSELTGLYKQDSIQTVKFANCLKKMTHRLYNLPEDPLTYEACKDTPLDDFWGLTPRQAYINVSEKYVKTVHGQSFFGRQLCKEIIETPNYEDKVFLVTDGGFLSEGIPLIDMFGADNIHVIYIKREGSSFKNDSRNYLPKEELKNLGVQEPMVLENNGSIVEGALKLSSCVRKSFSKLEVDTTEAT